MSKAHPGNVPGDWYVEDGCCLLCSVPRVVAPNHFEWARGPDGEINHCYVSRQPCNAVETRTMVEAAWGSETECIRYRGRDSSVLRLLRERGAASAIDKG